MKKLQCLVCALPLLTACSATLGLTGCAGTISQTGKVVTAVLDYGPAVVADVKGGITNVVALVGAATTPTTVVVSAVPAK